MNMRAGGVSANDAVLDLETLGTTPGCVILSIGATTLDGRKFYTTINEQNSAECGFHTSFDTMKWWDKQDKAVYAAARAGEHSVLGALERFAEWCKLNSVQAIWGNGSDFDNAILAAYYAELGIKQPWPYWGNRCFRTFKSVWPNVPTPEFVGIKHHALHDAEHERDHLVAILRHLNISPV